MKIVIQSGEVVTKESIETFLEYSPTSWTKGISSITVYVSAGDDLVCSFHKKEKGFGIHVPGNYSEKLSKVFAEIAVILQAIQDYGHIPDKLPASRVKEYTSRWRETL